MKKQFLIILLVIAGFVFQTPVSAQTLTVNQVENSIKNNGKYALLVTNARHFEAAVMTGEELKTQHPKIAFEIVLIGPIVKDLATDKSLLPFVTMSEKLGVRIVACEFAMQHFGVAKSQYHPSIETTPNGFTYIFGLQENGFKTITL